MLCLIGGLHEPLVCSHCGCAFRMQGEGKRSSSGSGSGGSGGGKKKKAKAKPKKSKSKGGMDGFVVSDDDDDVIDLADTDDGACAEHLLIRSHSLLRNVSCSFHAGVSSAFRTVLCSLLILTVAVPVSACVPAESDEDEEETLSDLDFDAASSKKDSKGKGKGKKRSSSGKEAKGYGLGAGDGKEGEGGRESKRDSEGYSALALGPDKGGWGQVRELSSRRFAVGLSICPRS